MGKTLNTIKKNGRLRYRSGLATVHGVLSLLHFSIYNTNNRMEWGAAGIIFAVSSIILALYAGLTYHDIKKYEKMYPTLDKYMGTESV